MTMKVRITNEDSERNLEIVTQDYEKGQVSPREFNKETLAPGTSTTIYIHLLRDLLVREMKP